jgi:type IV secretion system protein VirD4
MMTPQMKYVVATVSIVLGLIALEVILINMLLSPPSDPFTASLLTSLRMLYVTVVIILPLGIIGVVAWTYLFLDFRQSSKTYGSAHFASRREVRQAGMKGTEKTHVVTNEEGSLFVLGNAHRMQIALDENRQEGHVLVVAPTQRGKTASIIIPNLLNERGKRSLVINDVKHELIDLTIGALAERHTCYILSPTRAAESNGYNPLAHVVPESLSDSRNLAECIVKNTGSSGKEPFWDNAARLLLTATILHLRVTEPQAPFSRLADICTLSLPEISDLITKSQSPLARRVGTSFVKNVANEVRLQSNIMTDMSTRLFDAMDPQIETVTSYDELDFHQLAEQPCVLFLHIPPHEATRLKWLSSCLIVQLVNYLSEHPHKMKISFYLDELSNMGYIPNYVEYISYIRSAGISFLQVIQDFGQLVRLYDEDGRDTLLANSGTKVFLSGVGQVEAEYASNLLGNATVHSQSRSESEGRETVSRTEVGRKLLNPDEIRSLSLWTQLVFIVC